MRVTSIYEGQILQTASKIFSICRSDTTWLAECLSDSDTYIHTYINFIWGVKQLTLPSRYQMCSQRCGQMGLRRRVCTWNKTLRLECNLHSLHRRCAWYKAYTHNISTVSLEMCIWYKSDIHALWIENTCESDPLKLTNPVWRALRRYEI